MSNDPGSAKRAVRIATGHTSMQQRLHAARNPLFVLRLL